MSSGKDSTGAWSPPQRQPSSPPRLRAVPGDAESNQPQSGSPPSAHPPEGASAVKFPLVVRYSRTGEYLVIAVGLCWMIGALLHSRGPRTVILVVGIVVAVVVVIRGSGQDFVVIQPDEVVVHSRIGTTARTVPINGIQDLELSGRRLLRRGDGKVIARIISVGTNRFDTDALSDQLARVARLNG